MPSHQRRQNEVQPLAVWLNATGTRLPDAFVALLMRYFESLASADRETRITPRDRDRAYHLLVQFLPGAGDRGHGRFSWCRELDTSVVSLGCHDGGVELTDVAAVETAAAWRIREGTWLVADPGPHAGS